MDARLYTVHSRGRTNELWVVADAVQRLGFLPPVWAAWHGLWLVLVAMLALIVGVALTVPQYSGLVWLGLILLTTFEGAEIERLELRLRGWREVGVVEARSEVGAEETFLTGAAA